MNTCIDVAAVRAEFASYAAAKDADRRFRAYALAGRVPELADALDLLARENERLRDANANLIRNAEILADEVVLGTRGELS